jgi:hypothetical protein
MRQKARRDANETEIIQALQRLGYGVYRLSDPGFPDLAIWRDSWGRFMIPVEVKAKRGQLTMAQRRYPGPRTVVRSVDEIVNWAFQDPVSLLALLRPYLHHQPMCSADSFETGQCHCGLRKALQAAGLLPIQSV